LKITKTLKQFIISEVEHYSYLLKLKKVPDIALEVIPSPNKNSCYNKYGVLYDNEDDNTVADLLFINIAKLPNSEAIVYQIIHELVHKKHPQLKHGKGFDKIVGDLMTA
jgi:hypothetical protein